jgi:hypothetical protein
MMQRSLFFWVADGVAQIRIHRWSSSAYRSTPPPSALTADLCNTISAFCFSFGFAAFDLFYLLSLRLEVAAPERL